MSDFLQEFPDMEELKKLIMHTSETVWKYEITEREINRWLDNFTGEVLDVEEERVLALWLLANYVYYNEEEVRHLCRVLMRRFVHDMLISLGTRSDEIDDHLAKIISKTVFAYLGEPSESGGYILYYFRQENNLPLASFIPPRDLASVDNLVLIDDVTLTAGPAGQAYDQLKGYVDTFPSKKVVLLTLIASETSVTTLNTIGVKVIATIMLDERNQCFCPNSYILQAHPRYMLTCKKVILHYGTKINPWPLGYKNGEYTFGFFYNTPDNTLPIFWSAANGWYPIFKRYGKNYGVEPILNERFL